jgi:DNA-binding NarL/FixJ family response regulator
MKLTHRQEQVVTLLRDGMTYQGIARKLGIRKTTVRTHVRMIAVQLDSHYPAKIAVTMYSQDRGGCVSTVASHSGVAGR